MSSPERAEVSVNKAFAESDDGNMKATG